ncbi:hypothetical protein DFJ74DRAFT_701167 [Hyaloraphidium curvatum]|nr:hypothetical protein DFJ74DRAFT_701167 [Hyaloraphidium curvatum]
MSETMVVIFSAVDSPLHVAMAASYVLRLRRRLDAGPDAAAAASSRTWGWHSLVLVVSLMLARKFADDGLEPGAALWAEAGGFPRRPVVAGEREMLGMLGWDLS